MKEQSKEWRTSDKRPAEKAKMVLSAGKVMATVFWNSRGIILVDYIVKEKTINGKYYTTLLQRLRNEIKEKLPHFATKKLLLHLDNAPVHSGVGNGQNAQFGLRIATASTLFA